MNALETLFKEKASDKYLEFAMFKAEDVRKAILEFATKDILEFTELGEDDYTEGRNAVVLEIASKIRKAVKG